MTATENQKLVAHPMSLREEYLPRHSKRSVTLIALCFLLLSVFGALLTLIPSSSAFDPDRGIAMLAGLVFSVLALVFARANKTNAAVYSICALVLVAQVLYQSKVGLGIRSPVTSMTLLLVPFAGLLLGSRAAKLAFVTSVTWLLGLTAIELVGAVPGFTTGNAPILLPSLFIELVLVTSLFLLTERYLTAVQSAVEDMAQEQAARFKAETEVNEAKSEARYKDEFMAMLSHEIRTPLNGVTASMQLMFHAKATTDMRDRARLAMQQSVDNVNEVLNNLLENSKVEAGKLELHRKPTLLQEFMQTIKTVHSVRAEQKGLDFKVDCADLPVDPVQIDAPRLRQMLNNLVSNAFKFTEKGSVQIRVEQPSTDTILFSVTDTGCGMSEKDAPLLFQEYSQLRNQGVDTVGTGLGLVVVKKLATLMGGDVGASSKPGHGCTFWFTIKV